MAADVETTGKPPVSFLGAVTLALPPSTYAQLDIENVRAELGITTAALLGLGTEVGKVEQPRELESRVERLIREIGELLPEERRELQKAITI